MEDYSLCPKKECSKPAELDLAKKFGKYTSCSFMFFLGCKEKYHFFKQCPKVRADYLRVAAKEKYPEGGSDHLIDRSLRVPHRALPLVVRQVLPQWINGVSKVDGSTGRRVQTVRESERLDQ